MDRGGLRGFGGKKLFEMRVYGEAIFFEEVGELCGGSGHGSGGGGAFGGGHCSDSGSKGSAASLPSAFLSRISTRPSASSSCFWHSRESSTPSSKSFMASSRESCGLSRRRTTSSRRPRDFSKSGFFGGSGFLSGVEFKSSLGEKSKIETRKSKSENRNSQHETQYGLGTSSVAGMRL